MALIIHDNAMEYHAEEGDFVQLYRTLYRAYRLDRIKATSVADYVFFGIVQPGMVVTQETTKHGRRQHRFFWN